MEQNTIIIGIEEYNRLRDFKNDVMRGEIGVKYFSEYYGEDLHFHKQNEVIDVLNKNNGQLIKRNDKLFTENNTLKEAMKKHPIEISVKLTDKEIAKFSILQFLRFRKNFKENK